MEGIRGAHAFAVDAADLAARLRGCHGILMDIGTGDGQYVRHVARACPSWFAIGIDACRENLRAASRTAPDNALFAIANARALPAELYAQATRIVVNFPWGSLLEGLVTGDSSICDGLLALARPRATLDILLNAGALATLGRPAEAGGQQVRDALHQRGFVVGPPRCMDKDALRAYPSTWAKRLAHGRDPRAWSLTATCPPRSTCPLIGANPFLARRAESTRA